MLKKLLFLSSIILIISCNSEPSRFQLKAGDILFQDIDCGVYCESIESVTLGYKGANLSHCGIVIEQNNELVVIEAISKGVSITSIDSFLSRSQDKNGEPKVFVGRVKNKQVAENAQLLALQKLGKPYDEIYNLDDDTYYCSELVYYSFLKDGNPIFSVQPMTFKAMGSDSTFEAWQNYYDERELAVPEGELGLNPGSISLSDEIDIIHFFGKPDGVIE